MTSRFLLALDIFRKKERVCMTSRFLPVLEILRKQESGSV